MTDKLDRLIEKRDFHLEKAKKLQTRIDRLNTNKQISYDPMTKCKCPEHDCEIMTGYNKICSPCRDGIHDYVERYRIRTHERI